MEANMPKPQIDKILPNGKWSFDLEDYEEILCMDSDENIVLRIIYLLRSHHLSCEELQ
jgi:hypothetical protein